MSFIWPRFANVAGISHRPQPHYKMPPVLPSAWFFVALPPHLQKPLPRLNDIPQDMASYYFIPPSDNQQAQDMNEGTNALFGGHPSAMNDPTGLEFCDPQPHQDPPNMFYYHSPGASVTHAHGNSAPAGSTPNSSPRGLQPWPAHAYYQNYPNPTAHQTYSSSGSSSPNSHSSGSNSNQMGLTAPTNVYHVPAGSFSGPVQYFGDFSHSSPASDERFLQLTPSPVMPDAGQLPAVQVPVQQRPLYSHHDQLKFFREFPRKHPYEQLFIPQQMYKPHTNSDRRRYVEEVGLEEPIYFMCENPDEWGISLEDALRSRVKRLKQKEVPMFEERGPSVSIRLEWTGYGQWSRQIPTKDFKQPPCPITRAKLAKNVAKCVQRFIEEKKGHGMDPDVDPKWKVGDKPGQIKFEDLVLISLHHVSMGSWQPHLRLKPSF